MTITSMDHGPAALMIVCANITFLCLAGMTAVEPLVLVLGLVLFNVNFIMYLAVSFTAHRIYALCDQAQRNQLEGMEMYHEQQSDMIRYLGMLCELWSQARSSSSSSSSSSRSRSRSGSRSDDYSQPWDSELDRLYPSNSFYAGDGHRHPHSRPISQDEEVEYYSSGQEELDGDDGGNDQQQQQQPEDTRPKPVPRRRQRQRQRNNNHTRRQKKQAKQDEKEEEEEEVAEYREEDEVDVIDNDNDEGDEKAAHQCPCSSGGQCTCGDDCRCALKE